MFSRNILQRCMIAEIASSEDGALGADRPSRPRPRPPAGTAGHASFHHAPLFLWVVCYLGPYHRHRRFESSDGPFVFIYPERLWHAVREDLRSSSHALSPPSLSLSFSLSLSLLSLSHIRTFSLFEFHTHTRNYTHTHTHSHSSTVFTPPAVALWAPA